MVFDFRFLVIQAPVHPCRWRPALGWVVPRALALLLVSGGVAVAGDSIRSDGKMAKPTVVSRSEGGGKTTYSITGGTARKNGTYLFHSFNAFDLKANEIGHFIQGNSVQSIFSRVTGGTPSQINGLIKSDGSASLYLINPKGVVFGPNASLDVGGSFFASTADALTFGDEIFSATDSEGDAPLLTTGINPGLQFGSGGAQLAVAGSLQVVLPSST